MPLKGVTTGAQQSPMERKSFRTSHFQGEGLTGAMVIESVIVDVNLVNYTVDCRSKYDQRSFLDIQVGSPYMHFNRGEGMSVTPDVGAKCYVCIPSDGPPPFVLSFIMPMETLEGAVEGQSGNSGEEGTSTAVFSGGRKRTKPGDISLRGRDGQFLVLHRGGVLQIGATQLSQRIFIPLQNLMMDISQNYKHYNTGGSINWFVNRSADQDNPPTVLHETYRLLANDEKASLRVAVGKLSDIIKETDQTVISDLNQLEIGTEEPLVCEVVLSPDGFNAEDGATTEDSVPNTVLRYFFDKAGNCMMRTKGSVYVRIEKKFRISVDDDMNIVGKTNFRIDFEGTGRIAAQSFLDIVSGVVRFNNGKNAIATVGSTVEVTITPGIIPITGTVTPAGVVAGFIGTPVGGPIPTLSGIVKTGNPQLLG